MSAALHWAIGASAAETTAEQRAELGRALRALAGPEAVVIETCHRVELHGVGEPPALPLPRRWSGREAVRHAFRLAAGLESAVAGEPEVLGQVRRAHGQARAAQGRLDVRLDRLLDAAVATGRRARAGRALDGGLPGAAIEWAAARVDLAAAPALVVGGGPMGDGLARELAARGAEVVRARRRPAPGGLGLTEAAGLAPGCAVVAVAIRGTWDAVGDAAALPVLADLSSPPALSPAARLRCASHLGIDDLFAGTPTERGGAYAAAAEPIVEEAVEGHVRWLAARGSAEVARALTERVERRRQARVERVLRRLPGLDERTAALLEQLSKQLVGDLIHEPLAALAEDSEGEARAAARRLFAL